MNKGYVYINGKVVISDESGKQKAVDYYDNLDDVLIHEDIVETMESRIAELEKDCQFYKKNNKKHYIPFTITTAAFISTVGTNLMTYLLLGTNPFTSSLNTIFGVINVGLLNCLGFSTIFLPIGAIFEAIPYRQYKVSKRKEKGTESELEFLQKQIVQEKQVLEDLKNEKKREKEVKDFTIVEVDSKQQLETLKGYLSLYFDLGYNGDRYFRYYEQGKLDKKLSEDYTDRGIEIAKEYLEEKRPVLSRRKK